MQLATAVYRILALNSLLKHSLSEWASWPCCRLLRRPGKKELRDKRPCSQTKPLLPGFLQAFMLCKQLLCAVVQADVMVSSYCGAFPTFRFPCLLLEVTLHASLEECSSFSPLLSIGGIHVGVFRSWKQKSPIGPVGRGSSWNSTRKGGKDKPKVSWCTEGLF